MNILKAFGIVSLICCQAYCQNFTSSNLPIVMIDTEGQTILNEPKINVKLKIIQNTAGKRNNLTDTPTQYDGIAGIEYRGASSQLFPKKPYGIELRDEKGDGHEVSIFGMPKEEDWILFASYNEKSLINNVLAMKLARDLGMYASRTQYVELVLNGRYEGVYVWMEKIKRVNGRLDIVKMSDKDNSGDALTGGYIFKIDKVNGSGGSAGWFSQIRPSFTNNLNARIQYLFEYPDPDKITSQQRTYIQAKSDSAEAALNSTSFKDPQKGYRKYYDARSFMKFFLINEVSRNVDGYRISTFFHKDRDSKSPLIKAGPVWDFDLAFANADYCDGYRYNGWAYLFGNVCPNDYWQVPFHWKRMLEDPTFVSELYEEYTRMRANEWKTIKLHTYIDSLATLLREPQQRNFERWPNLLGQVIWPNPQPVPTTWQGEVDELKRWLEARLNWLDENMLGKITANELAPSVATEIKVEVFPNPISDFAKITIDAPRQMEIITEVFDLNGRLIHTQVHLLHTKSNQIQLPIEAQAGTYWLRVHTPTEVIKKKMIKL